MKPRIHMIGNAHIDPVWLWVWQDGLEVAQLTCRAAIKILDKHPDYIFSRSSAAVYRWIERTDPGLFSQIKRYVDQGRWNIVNGWWVQPDCNIPCGESLVRQGLYGQLYFKERFGKMASVGFNVDTFGHCGTLPQILDKCGLSYYVFMRPDPREKELPADLFWWQSPDGSRVLTCRIDSYNANDLEDLDRKLQRAISRARSSGLDAPCFYGKGDHGGGPAEDLVQRIEELRDEMEDVDVIFSTADDYFETISRLSPDLPTVTDELQHHSRGCYTVVSEIKTATRKLEVALLNSEKFCALASLHLGSEYPRHNLRQSWETLLFHQFHDVLGGTSIRPAYDDASRAMSMAMDIADSEAVLAMESLSAKIRTEGKGKPVLVFNPVSSSRVDPIHIESVLPSDEDLVAIDDDGNRHPLQVNRSEDFEGNRRVSAIFLAELPPLGYRVFWTDTGTTGESDLRAGKNSIENSLIRIEVDPGTGNLISIFDKTSMTEFLKGPSRAVILRDESDTWSHDVVEFDDEIGTFRIQGPPTFDIGPVSASISVTSTYGNSRLTQTLRLWSGNPSVDCTLDLDWHEKHAMLKMTYPVNLEEPRATYEVPYGTIERPTRGQEEPGQRWLDVSGRGDDGKEMGLLVVNESKYGFHVKNSEVGVSIVRSPIYAFHRPKEVDTGKTYLYTDQGQHRVGLLLLPHLKMGTEKKFQVAERFNNPPIVAFSNPHGGDLPPSASMVSCTPDNVLITALKLAEERDRAVLRLFECAGTRTRCSVDFPVWGTSFETDIDPWEIKTLVLSGDGVPEETDLLEGSG